MYPHLYTCVVYYYQKYKCKAFLPAASQILTDRPKIMFFLTCFCTELIYEELMDWEERNKNGLMKEDCSGQFRPCVAVRHVSPAVFNQCSGSVPIILSQMCRRLPPPSPPPPTTSHPCPQSTHWRRTQTAAASTR